MKLTKWVVKRLRKKFTFKEASGEVGGTAKDKNGTIVMTVTQGGENKVHELAHAYQQLKGTEGSVIEREEFAYGRQYAFDGNSMHTPSRPGVDL